MTSRIKMATKCRSRVPLLIGGLLFVTSMMQTGQAIKWLATGNMAWNSTLECTSTGGQLFTTSDFRRAVPGLMRSHLGADSNQHVLSRAQRATCVRHIDLMPWVSLAARHTIDLCQELFAERRWNCSSITLAPRFLPDLTGGSREQAFVYSLSSAALVHTVAKACSTAQSSKCHCGPIPSHSAPAGHRWGGCSDDLDFAVAFSEQFTDSQWTAGRRQPSKRALVNLQNNAAGRQIVSESLRTTCKCHGVSGACTIKTCWRSLPDIRSIAVAVQRRHAVAMEVKTASWPESAAATGNGGRQRRLVPSSTTGSRTLSRMTSNYVRSIDLVYYMISPDYCLPDVSLGSIGTRHRECRVADDGPSGCQSMCCGRGHQTVTLNVTQRCDCKYYWCCYVRCKTCARTVQLHRCR